MITPGQQHPHVHPKAIEGLLEESVLAKGSLSFKTPATVGAGKQACRQGHRVADGEASIVRDFGQELLPEVLLDLPEVGCLSGEGGAMHLAEGGEPFAVVAAEIAVDSLVGVEPQELAYGLDSDDFGVGERRGRAALADTMALGSVVYGAFCGTDPKLPPRRPLDRGESRRSPA